MHDESIPYGYCHCGCGGKAPISPVNHARLGYVKGEPRRYIRGHHGKRKIQAPRERSGVCKCGCGQPTPLATITRPNRGQVQGEPLDYIAGHSSVRKPIEWVAEDRGYTTPCLVPSDGRDGYRSTRGSSGKTTGTHRIAYERSVGLIPVGLELDHLCRVRACINPDHLEPVTHAENLRRMRMAKAKG